MIEAIPAVAMSLESTAAVSWVGLTYVVGKGVPYHSTVDCEVKPVPETWSEKAAPPDGMELGLRAVDVGRSGRHGMRSQSR